MKTLLIKKHLGDLLGILVLAVLAGLAGPAAAAPCCQDCDGWPEPPPWPDRCWAHCVFCFQGEENAATPQEGETLACSALPASQETKDVTRVLDACEDQCWHNLDACEQACWAKCSGAPEWARDRCLTRCENACEAIFMLCMDGCPQPAQAPTS